MMINILKQMF